MIVRDEAGNIERCLASVRDLVGEIVIVDTGSKDETVAIAESFGATVLHEPWRDDFGHARNIGLQAAKGPWILVLDADEVIATADHDAIRRAVRDAKVDSFTMRTRNYVDDVNVANAVPNVDPPAEGAGYPAWTPSDKVRLFRNAPHARFRGAIHEVVGDAIREAGGRVEFLDVPVHHYGFLAEGRKNAEKLAMQRRIAETKTAASPEDFKAWWELGVIAHRQNDRQAAVDALRKSAEFRGDWPESRYELAHVLEELERFDEAVAEYQTVLRLDRSHTAAALNLGRLLFRAGNLADAEAAFRSAAEHAPNDARGWNNLGAVLGEQKRYAEAGEAWRRALKCDPANVDAKRNLDTLERLRKSDSKHAINASLCMIVRNEADNLPQAIGPLRALFDEIVVVDTGSTDDTVAVAESLGATVVRFPWCEDFAAARNVGLDRAQGKWIVWLDADDRVPAASVPHIRASLARPADRAVQWRVRSRSGGREPVEFLQIRQFPRRDDLRFTGRIHENVLRALRAANLPIRNVPDIVVQHVGYEDDATLAKKHERNLRLLELAHADAPDDAMIVHHLSQTYALLGHVQEAREAAERILALEPLEGDERYLGLQARVRLAQIARREQRADDAIALLQEALKIVLHFPPAEYLLGELLWKNGNLAAAREHLDAVSRAQMPVSEMPIPLPALRAGAHNVLGRMAQDAGDHADACARFESALAEAPDVAVIHANYAESLAHLGRTAAAKQHAERALELAPADLSIVSSCRKLLEPAAATDERPVLSLCMIVRDEEANLRELLPLVRPHVDELIVVDTGSTDGTVAVAESFGARIGTFPWCDDFAAARNASLDMATGRWILWLDADDRIEPDDLRMMRIALASLPPQAIRLPVHAVMPQGELLMLSVRVFPGGQGVRFAGRVHEDVGPSCAALGLTIADNEQVVIRHVGYAGVDALDKKFERNRRLLEMQVAEDPNNVRAALYLIGAELYFGHRDAARSSLNAVFERPLSELERAEALRFQSALLKESGDMNAWRTAALEWHRLRPNDAAAVVNAAEALAAHKAWREVVRVLEQTPAAALRPGNVPVDLRALQVQHGLSRGRAYRELGRLVDAVDALSHVLHLAPDHADALFELANVHWDAQRWDAADATYAQLLQVRPDHAPALVQRGNIAFQRGDYPRADALYAEALRRDPSFRAARENACAVALQMGDAPLARQRLTQALQEYPDALPLRVYLADLDYGEGRYGPALDGYRRYLTTRPTDVKALTRLGDCLRLLGHPNEARTAYTAVLKMDADFTSAADGLRALQTV